MKRLFYHVYIDTITGRARITKKPGRRGGNEFVFKLVAEVAEPDPLQVLVVSVPAITPPIVDVEDMETDESGELGQ